MGLRRIYVCDKCGRPMKEHRKIIVCPSKSQFKGDHHKLKGARNICKACGREGIVHAYGQAEDGHWGPMMNDQCGYAALSDERGTSK